jgi:hypothetical protein
MSPQIGAHHARVEHHHVDLGVRLGDLAHRDREAELRGAVGAKPRKIGPDRRALGVGLAERREARAHDHDAREPLRFEHRRLHQRRAEVVHHEGGFEPAFDQRALRRPEPCVVDERRALADRLREPSAQRACARPIAEIACDDGGPRTFGLDLGRERRQARFVARDEDEAAIGAPRERERESPADAARSSCDDDVAHGLRG